MNPQITQISIDEKRGKPAIICVIWDKILKTIMSDPETIFPIVALGLILTRYFFELWLDGVNAAYVRKHSD